MIRILSIFGTRPEAIKMAPVIKELNRHPEEILSITCSTGQHREMLNQVMALFDIQPDIDLNLMQPGQTPTQVASRVLAAIEPILETHRPDWILVQGDTTTVMASAIAAHHARVRIGHVEAGLRTGDRWHPFPEEMNRVLADHLSDLCFAPTERARRSLLEEGIVDKAICVTGNTGIDALLEVAQMPWIPGDGLSDILSGDTRLILVTAHRRESFGNPLKNICFALKAIAQQADGGVHIIYPVHPNPQVRGPVYEALADVPGITLVPPVDYLTLVNLMKRSTIILTDSGGIQEEAPTLGIPVLVLRDMTERPEAVEAGSAQVVGTRLDKIVEQTFRLLHDPSAYAAMAQAGNPYGNGHAAERIVREILAKRVSDTPASS